MWIGTLKQSVLDARPGPLPWMACAEPKGNTLNIYKAIALLALFDMPRPPSAVMYLDADAWFSDAAFEHRASKPGVKVALESFPIWEKRRARALERSHAKSLVHPFSRDSLSNLQDSERV